MNPVLSIIIPVFREKSTIKPCLTYLERCPGIEQCEIIVVDGDAGSTATPTGNPRTQVLVTSPGRGHQLNTGAMAAASTNLLFLHVDTKPPRDFVRHVTDALRRHVAGAFDLRIDSTNYIVKLIGIVGMIRSRLTRVPYGDQVQFIRRDLFRLLGGFPEIPIMEDVALMDKIRAAGESIVFLRPPARSSGRRWEKEGAVRTTLRNWRVFAAYRAGVAPEVLARSYRPHSETVDRRKIIRIRRPRGPEGEPYSGSGVFLSSSAVLVFYRALRSDGVKTRLAKEIGAAAALAIYRAMVEDLRDELACVSAGILPFVDAPDAGELLFDGSRPQSGDSLGERMANALAEVFGGAAEAAVLVGSDIPGISATVINEALSRLGAADAVIGPSRDGGYYLIGFTRSGFTRRAFDPLLGDWTTSGTSPILERTESRQTILKETVAAVRHQGRAISILTTLLDVDTVDDLKALYRRSQGHHPHLDAVVRELLGETFITRQ